MKCLFKYLILCLLLLVFPFNSYGEDQKSDSVEKTPTFSISGDINETMAREAAMVKEELKNQARSLFERDPFGWNFDTILFIYKWALTLPLKIPELTRTVAEQSRVLGVIGSLVMLTFFIAILYSVIGQKRVLRRMEEFVHPFREKIPEAFYPYFISILKVVIAAFIPLILFAVYSFLNALIAYEAAWFQFLGELLKLWAIGSLIVGLLRELLTQNLISNTALYGMSIYRPAKLIVYYVLIGLAVFAGAEDFQIRNDTLSLLKFVISISIVIALFFLFLKKKALLSLLPNLPYQSWRNFYQVLEKYYFPVIFASLFFAFLWCLGYKRLGEVVLLNSWLTAGAFMLIVLAYHILQRELLSLAQKSNPADEAAQLLIKSARTILLYSAVLGTIFIVLNLLGLLNPLQRLMSFNVLILGNNIVTLWVIIKAILILVAFIFLSRVLQAYLDYKIYPKLGVDPGLAYALNTFLKYFSVVIGILLSLKIVGIDLRFLLVFAGAIGIGVGLGLQNMAGNMISGFSIIFGGKIRKDDWIEVSGTLGMVTDILLWATKIRTRDNIEYLIPNTDFIAGVTVNYSLSSPLIRLALPVGVSYDADPREVEKILVKVAENEPLVEKHKKPSVRFIGYGDNAIDFQLLFWIDIRKTARRKVRSELYFAVFDEFKAAGIEIPYPQRDIHIKSQPGPVAGSTE